MTIRLRLSKLPVNGLHTTYQWEFHVRMLRRFAKLIDAYSDRNDLAYWYGERMLVGLMASAVWQIRGWAVEEGTVSRGHPDPKRAKRGRCDLWYGPSAWHDWLTLEAKRTWTRGGPTGTVKRVTDQLHSARAQLARLEHGLHRAGVSLGLCFLTPYLSGDQQHQDEALNAVTSGLCKRFTSGRHWIATMFDDNPSRVRAIAKQYDKDYGYPGLIIVGEFWRHPGQGI